ncbi:MAG: ABC transporter permease [Tepidisphaerales bacterium]
MMTFLRNVWFRRCLRLAVVWPLVHVNAYALIAVICTAMEDVSIDDFMADWRGRLFRGLVPLVALGLCWLIEPLLRETDIPLTLKQMRQRFLSSTLTILSVMLGVGLAIAVMLFQRESEKLFGQSDFGYDVIVGPPKGSPLQLTLNTVYHLDVSPGLIPYELYEEMSRDIPPIPGKRDYRPFIRSAVPFMVGDSFAGRRIVGTSPQMFAVDDNGQPITKNPFQYRVDKSFELAAGRVFAPRKFEAVIGSDVAEKLHLKLYDDKLSEDQNEKQGGAFRATHGMPRASETPDIHKPRWHIVGILKPTHTAADRVLYVPFISLYAIAEHLDAMIEQAAMKAGIDLSKIPPDRLDDVLRRFGFDPAKVPERVKAKFKIKSARTRPTTAPKDIGELLQDAALPAAAKATPEQHEEDEDAFKFDADGNIIPDLPKEEWELSAILVRSKGSIAAMQLVYQFKVIDNRATAAAPAMVMRDFFDTFLKGSSLLLLAISGLVTIVAAVSILVSIYNSVVARRREIAILRALGATRLRVLLLICGEAAIIGAAGGILGVVLGHALGFGGSVFIEKLVGQEINWIATSPFEWLYLELVILLSALAGLVPALVAYRTPVATNLVAG